MSKIVTIRNISFLSLSNHIVYERLNYESVEDMSDGHCSI
jgi:hypothetical protein